MGKYTSQYSGPGRMFNWDNSAQFLGEKERERENKFLMLSPAGNQLVGWTIKGGNPGIVKRILVERFQSYA